MIFVAILDLIFTLISPLLNLVLPLIPADLLRVGEEAITHFADGCKWLIYVLWTPSLFRQFIIFIASVTLVLYGLDLIWKVINLIKLKRGGE